MSGGELQRVAIALCLGKPADVYLIDEPSAYLDSEQRLHAAKVIKRFILHAKKTGNLTMKLCFIKFCFALKVKNFRSKLSCSQLNQKLNKIIF